MSPVKEIYRFVVDDEGDGERLDSFLSTGIPELSRSRLQRSIKAGECLVDGKVVLKPSFRLGAGSVVRLSFSPPEPLLVEAEPIDIDVVFEDDWIVVVNKPPGMVTHPAPGHRSGTLVNALLHHCNNLSGIGGVMRPGIVHRLDAGTSGLLVVAKNDEAHISLSRQLMQREVHRVYLAVVWGKMPLESGTIDAPIGRSTRDRKKMAVLPGGGKRAVTHYSVVDTFGPFQYIRLKLETGRTHQIRVHLSHIGHPVLGDPVYGGRKIRRGNLSRVDIERAKRVLEVVERQLLHALSLEFKHPATGERMKFDAPPPEDFRRALDILSSNGR